MQVDFARREALREVHRVARLEEDMQSPALHPSGLVLPPGWCFRRLGHAPSFAATHGFPAEMRLFAAAERAHCLVAAGGLVDSVLELLGRLVDDPLELVGDKHAGASE